MVERFSHILAGAPRNGLAATRVTPSGADVSPLATSVFVVPVLDEFLLYAPLHHVAALMNREALVQVERFLCAGTAPTSPDVADITHTLQMAPVCPPQPKTGALAPAFLGLIPTRRCNLACRYCGFAAEPDGLDDMSLPVAHAVVEWYLDLVRHSRAGSAEMHFFGGEPFCAPQVVDLTVHQARLWSQEVGVPVRFEVATNGVFSERRARWVGANFDTVVLSLDGLPETHDDQRIYPGGGGTFDAVDRTARILSDGETDLFLRVCITARTVHQMPEIARRFCEWYRPRGICFEPIQPADGVDADEFAPPDAWEFAVQFIQVAQYLADRGVEAVYAAADIDRLQTSFCPAGRDVVIAGPDGRLSACYLLSRDWTSKGMDMHLGQVDGDMIPRLDVDSLGRTRDLNVCSKPFCARCLGQWHCAGGCHVNHRLPPAPGPYDRLCIQTRCLTIANVLMALGRRDLLARWMADRAAMEKTVGQPSDLLADVTRAL